MPGRRGAPIESLAGRYHRTKTSMYRVINEIRARRIMEQPLDYIPNTVFGRASLEKTMLGEMPAVAGIGRSASETIPAAPATTPMVATTGPK